MNNDDQLEELKKLLSLAVTQVGQLKSTLAQIDTFTVNAFRVSTDRELSSGALMLLAQMLTTKNQRPHDDGSSDS